MPNETHYSLSSTIIDLIRISTSQTITPTGPVTFIAGKTLLGTVQLNGGKAELTTSSLPAGTDAITVKYTGNSNIKGTMATVSQIVNP